MSALGGLAGAWLWQRSPTRRVAAWVLAVAGPALVTLALIPFRASLMLGGFLFCTLLVIIAIAVIGGARPALTGVALSVLARVFFFAPPFENLGAGMQPSLVSLITFTIVGAAVALLIDKLAQLAEEQASSQQVEAALRRVATLVAHGVPPAEIFSAVAGEARRLFDAHDAAVFRFEPDGGAILVAGLGPGLAGAPAGARREPDDISATTAVWRTGRPARVDEDAWSTASGPFADFVRTLGLSSVVASPITVQDRLWGALAVTMTRKTPPPDTEARLAFFTELVGTAISNAENLAELTASRARVVATADETRRKIERDLHDGAQQRLVSLALALRAAQMAVPQPGELRDELAHVAEGLASVQNDLREMARGIHPAILAQGGLAPALKTLARRCSVPVELEVRAQERLPERVEVAAYYVVSEALANAAKHAHASVIHVDAEAAGRVLRLCVRDDGAGGADPVRGSGLVGLKDRIEALGGTITIDSPAGEGTSLHAELPLPG